MSLTKRVLLAMVCGIVVGIGLNNYLGITPDNPVPATPAGQWILQNVVDGFLDAIGQIFLASLKLLVVPLVFISMVGGSASLGNHSSMGRMAGKTIFLYTITTSIAVSIALAIALAIGPGEGLDMKLPENVAIPDAPSIKDTLIGIFPSNPIQAMAEGNMLQIIVFSLLFGIAVSRTETSRKYILELFEHLNNVIIKMILMLMELAPYGVFCLLAKLFVTTGYEAVLDLAKYFFTLLGILIFYGVCVYSLMLKAFTGLSPLKFGRKMWPVLLFGFSTSSSGATMPFTMRTIQHDLGVDNKVASFTVPLGTAINMDGTAIMQGVATVFIAQAYGIDIGLSGYLMVIITASLAAIGTAAVPSAGMIMLAMVLQQAGLPLEGIALVLSVDRLLDMVRTSVNIAGDGVVSCIVANSEKLLDRERFNDMNKTV